MDTLHTVLRAISGDKVETKSKPDHLTVFREFLAHLDVAQRKATRIAKAPRAKSSKRKTAKRAKA